MCGKSEDRQSACEVGEIPGDGEMGSHSTNAEEGGTEERERITPQTRRKEGERREREEGGCEKVDWVRKSEGQMADTNAKKVESVYEGTRAKCRFPVAARGLLRSPHCQD